MPRRRSSRLKGKAVEEVNVESELVKDIASKTKDIESVSNNNGTQNNKKLTIEEVEQKDPSEPQSLEQTPDPASEQQPSAELPATEQATEPQNDNQDADEQGEDEEEEEEEEEEEQVNQTLIAGRSRRNVAKRSYKDDSSSEEEDEDEDPMYVGLSKEQKQAMKAKMAQMQQGCNDATLKERALKIQEIIGSFELNIDADVTEEEAAFIYDFSRKHQFDVIEKIEDEGDFFLDSMREMIEEKMKLHQAGIRTNGGKRKRRKDEDSESEFDMADFEDSDSDSEYSLDSDFENPFLDNENMIDEYEDEEDYAAWGDKKRRRRGGRRRNKNIYKVDGREYYAKGRLLLTDALKDTVNFEGWSAARVKAWKNKAVNPNAYHYRFNLPGEEAVNGGLREVEIKPFMERVKELGVNVHWGTFSMVIKGRVGYQCSNYWRQFMKDGWVKDPNYWVLPDGKFQFKRSRAGAGDIPENIRKYSFVVLKDPSGTFGPDFPAFHPKRPSDAQLKKWLETNVRDLDDSVKAGKKGKKKSKARGKGKKKKNDDNETKDNKEEQDKEETTNDDKNDDDETTDKDNKKTKKSKKKGSKKKKDKKKKNKKKDKKDGDDDNEENDETKEDKKTKKKKKSKKSKKSSKKDKKKKDKKSKSKKKSKKKKDKKGAEEEETNNNDIDEKQDEDKDVAKQETASKSKRGKKRKHSESAGDEPSDLEPPQKKRKKMNKSKKGKKEDKNKKQMNGDSEKENEETNDALSQVLGDMVDIMTGDKLIDPAISPFGYVMSYNSW
eukprot:CAMPEP_0201571690 /NCGR_PEP_ID=MMETSP0190_2-20130828/14577_1 /ASSEMBLY_ACC=CAM_ASM_000263 /TAXON_ID=37353 /ORGANISM="Rosalina sp." /LENGTH=776 /DNA_ID=CAMNT_0047996609 /DNA_START=97 /DNA_END=2424 /DNA_ORIENTATION=-